MRVYSQEVARVLGRGDWKKGAIKLKAEKGKIEIKAIVPKFPEADLSSNIGTEKKGKK